MGKVSMLVSSLDSSTLNLIDLNNINNHISRGVNIPTGPFPRRETLGIL